MQKLSLENKKAMRLGARCDLCPLRGNPLVWSTPASGKLKLIIVGEGPGRNEEKLGAPFVGLSGKLLDGELRSNSLPRSACHITNVALCRGDTDKENDRAAECCAPRLLRELREVVVANEARGDAGGAQGPSEGTRLGVPALLLGKSALRAVLNLRAILVARGFVFRLQRIEVAAVREAFKKASKLTGERKSNAELKAETLAGRKKLRGMWCVPALHPSFILRADTWLPLFQIDVRRAIRLARGEVVGLDDAGKHRVGGLEVLRDLGDTVSCDIETDGIDPMVCGMLCVGVSDSKRTAVVWPWKKKFARGFSEWMKGKKGVVFHNGL